MAKKEYTMRGDFDKVLEAISREILEGSVSASLEDSGDCVLGDTRCAVRVFERYSTLGGNRLSLSVTLCGCGEQLWLCAISAGGSNAVFWKVNTWGEEAFLEELVRAVQALPVRDLEEGNTWRRTADSAEDEDAVLTMEIKIRPGPAFPGREREG